MENSQEKPPTNQSEKNVPPAPKPPTVERSVSNAPIKKPRSEKQKEWSRKLGQRSKEMKAEKKQNKMNS